MQYYDRVSLKQQAKNSMKTTKPSVFIATLVYFLILVVLSNLAYRLTGVDRLYGDLYELAGSGQTVDYGTMIQGYRDLIPTVAPFASLLAMIISLMNAVIGAGYAGY